MTTPQSSYVPGSILRIILTNFVTYTHVVIHPGPHLNMVIGPNGTGKSTIVCAIALGVGAKTTTLGRAKDVKEFIKQGEAKCVIEITFKGDGDDDGEENNYTIERIIAHDTNENQYKINGQKAKVSEVTQLVADMNIQIDNLCQFLPQEKVGDFADLDSKHLLRETQRAARGEIDLVTLHEMIIEQRKDQKLQEQNIAVKKEEKERLQQHADTMERDVERYKERQKIEKSITLLELKKPFVEYSQAKSAYDESKALREEAQDFLDQVRSQAIPESSEMQRHKTALDEGNLARRTLSDEYSKVETEMRNWNETQKKGEKKTAELRQELMDVRRRADERRHKIQRLSETIEEKTAELARKPVLVFDEEGLNTAKSRSREACNLKLRIENEIRAAEENTRERQQLASENQAELVRVTNIRQQRLGLVRSARNGADCIAVHEWCEQHKAEFENPVYAPILLDVIIKPLETIIKKLKQQI